jgi:uncharacterized protein YbjT (DUF2867 family)
MPVLVTSPRGEVGEGLVARLAATGGQVRAYGPDLAVGELRRLGVVCAQGSFLDEGHLETAMEQVHTVVHLGFNVLAEDPERLVEEAATLVTAAIGARVRRIIAMTVPEGPPAWDDALRRAAADVELLIAGASCPTVAVRPGLVDTEELRHALSRTPLTSDALDAMTAPVDPDDVAALMFQLDERRDVLDVDHSVLAADGPELMTVRAYLELHGITPMSGIGRLVERVRGGTPLLATALEVGWVSGEGVTDGWAASGLDPRPLLRDP